MITKTRAIVLRTIKYGEAQVIVDLLTESHGRLSFMQHIPKAGRAKVKKRMLQPLTILEIEFDYHGNSSMQRMKDASIAVPFMSIPFDVAKLSVALFITEVLRYCTRAGQGDPPMFGFIEKSLIWLDTCRGNCANFHIAFMTHLTVFLGIVPYTGNKDAGTYFDMRNGCFTALPPKHPDYLTPDKSTKVQAIMRMNYDNMRLFSMTRAERNECVDIIITYYRLHVPDFPELKSLPVLKELFV